MTQPLRKPIAEAAMPITLPLNAAEARALVEATAEQLTKCWPLKSYIACNPLLAYEDKPFFAAIRAAQQDGIWPEGVTARAFAPALAQGALHKPHLHRRFVASLARLAQQVPGVSGQHALLWADLLADLSPQAPQGAPSPALLAAAAAVCPRQSNTAAPTLDTALQRLDAATATWCAAYLDEGQAVWDLPARQHGLLAAWRALAGYDPTLSRTERQTLTALLAALPQDGNAALAELLNRSGAEPQAQLLAHMARVPGWVGYLRWKATHPDARQINRAKTALTDMMVMRLVYAAVFGAVLPQAPAAPRQGFAASELALRLYRSACALPIAESDILQMLAANSSDLVQALAAFDDVAKTEIVLDALEDSQRTPVLAALATTASAPAASPGAARPLAQVVFCIDVRSEPFRRQLEHNAPAGVTIETLGFAGFFGIPMRLRPFGGGETQDLCPVLLHPRYEIEETPQGCTPHQARQAEQRQHTLRQTRKLLVDLKASVAATFGMVETTGLAYGLAAIGKTLAPQGFHRMGAALRQWFAPEVPTTPLLFGCGHTVQSGLVHGLTEEEQAFFAETALTMMGLVRDFAPLVLLCGHGSQTVNNPYAAALDCGACGGNHGGANARVLAAILNSGTVRAALAERGIVIPAETLFLAGEHNTTTDAVVIYSHDPLPAARQAELYVLQQALDAAASANRAVRQAQLPGADSSLRNAVDWSQVRPEWGLANNAFFIAGPRALTRTLDLGGRAFLHSYDHTVDPEGKALEIILTAPLVVAEWINTQYLFSTLDNHRFGSGTKITHNVVGKFGILQGNTGDLQVGLPLQSVMRAEGDPYHTPVRLMAVVVAPRAMVAKLIARHTILQRFFNNGWVALTVIEPDTGSLFQYKGHTGWEPVAAEQDGHPVQKPVLATDTASCQTAPAETL